VTCDEARERVHGHPMGSADVRGFDPPELTSSYMSVRPMLDETGASQ